MMTPQTSPHPFREETSESVALETSENVSESALALTPVVTEGHWKPLCHVTGIGYTAWPFDWFHTRTMPPT